jgi:hypothetical protein
MTVGTYSNSILIVNTIRKRFVNHVCLQRMCLKWCLRTDVVHDSREFHGRACESLWGERGVQGSFSISGALSTTFADTFFLSTSQMFVC